MILGKEQGTNSVTIRDEPTVGQVNKDAQNWFAEEAFNAIFRDRNQEKAKSRISWLDSQKLDRLIHAAKKLLILAESEQRIRRFKESEAVRDEKPG